MSAWLGGTDPAGHLLASGVCSVRLAAAGNLTQARVALVR